MPKVNQRISEYLLDELIGRGTFGEVWKAHHHIWVDQFVAIKIPTDSQYVRNLQHEGITIHGLVHANIVRAIGFDPYGDPPYLTMEYIPGTSLRPLISARMLKPADAVAILRQVLAGLGHAHANGVIHRDIKPENVLIHQRTTDEGFGLDGGVKVTDFGLGRAAATTAVGSIVYSADLGKKDSHVAGTLDYMSPEQRAGDDVDGRADIYACGVMLYEMLTGERPAGTDVPSDINPRSPKILDEVFRRSYARLERRFVSVEEFVAALSVAAPPPLRSAPPPLSASPPPVPMPSKPTAPHPPAGPTVCPHCRRPVDRADQFCMHCGRQLVAEIRRCPKCGAYPDAGDRNCIFCGQILALDGSVIV